MEVIRKKICIDKSRLHVKCGLPFYKYNTSDSSLNTYDGGNGTYGNFVADIKEDCQLYSAITSTTSTLVTDGVIRGNNLFHRYVVLLEMMRKGLHLKNIATTNSCSGTGYTTTYTSNFDYTGTTLDFFNECAVSKMFDSNGNSLFNEISYGRYTTNSVAEKYVTVLYDYDEFIRLGGLNLIKIISEIVDNGSGCTATTISSSVPYISIPLLLTVDEEDLGVMTPYQDEENDFSYSGGSLEPIYSATTIEVESKLETLKSRNNDITDNGEILPGCISDSDRLALINGTTHSITLELPYTVGTVLHKDTTSDKFTGDYIISIAEESNRIVFEYVIGGEFEDETFTTRKANTGIHYSESYPYVRGLSGETDSGDTLYGVSGVSYTYNKIDFNNKTKTVHSDDFNLDRDTVIGEITAMTFQDVWESGDTVLNTPLIKEDYMMSMSMDSTIDVDVTIDRGNATAFEKHLILGECNSFEDLQNYRNNFYNLE